MFAGTSRRNLSRPRSLAAFLLTIADVMTMMRFEIFSIRKLNNTSWTDVKAMRLEMSAGSPLVTFSYHGVEWLTTCSRYVCVSQRLSQIVEARLYGRYRKIDCQYQHSILSSTCAVWKSDVSRLRCRCLRHSVHCRHCVACDFHRKVMSSCSSN